MSFFNGLETIKLFNSLFELIEPYTKDMVCWLGIETVRYQNQTKSEIYQCKEKLKVTI